MKKIMIAVAIVCAAVMSQAASTDWKMSASNIVGTDNTGTYTGSAVLQYLVGSVWTDVGYSATVSDGAIKLSANTFSSTLFTPDQDYDFRFVITDGDKTFTSNTKSVTAQSSSTASIKFGDQTGNQWQSVPEPTSGLLLLLGMAGLALRRKQK